MTTAPPSSWRMSSPARRSRFTSCSFAVSWTSFRTRSGLSAMSVVRSKSAEPMPRRAPAPTQAPRGGAIAEKIAKSNEQTDESGNRLVWSATYKGICRTGFV